MLKSQTVSISQEAPALDARRIQTRRSGVHGKGVFALADLAEGETILEYVGEVITWVEALRRHPHDPQNPNHTFYFHIDDKHVIDGKAGGNSSRWINHSCQPRKRNTKTPVVINTSPTTPATAQARRPPRDRARTRLCPSDLVIPAILNRRAPRHPR